MKPKGGIKAKATLCLALLTGILGCGDEEFDVLTLPSEIRSLDLNQARKGIPAIIDGFVTNYDPHTGILYIHDGRSGLEVPINHVEMASFFSPGIKVKINGKTGVSGQRPVITQADVTISGMRSELPAPDFVDLPDKLQKPSWQSQWVKIPGVVRRIYLENGEIQTLELTSGGQKFIVRLMRDFGFESKSFLNKHVLVSGVNITEIPAEGGESIPTLTTYSSDWIDLDEKAASVAPPTHTIPVSMLSEADIIVRSGKK